MKKVSVNDLRQLMSAKLCDLNVPKAMAENIADIYIRASLRSVGHHDIHDFNSRIKQLEKGLVNPSPTLECLSSFGGVEAWNGDNGLGELCCHHATMRSMALAKANGIGFVTISNSNHFLAAAPYSEIADEGGCLSLVMSKSPGGLTLPGADCNIMGNNPFGFAAGHSEVPINFDVCCAYSSYGKMGAKAKAGEKVPDYWGYDQQGQPTTDPSAIKDSGLYLPIGGHKGFGLAIMVELFTSVLGGGAILNQSESETGMKGQYSQSVISVDVSRFMAMEDYEDRVGEMVGMFRTIYPEVYIPGQRSNESKSAIIEKGYFEISEEIASLLLMEG